MRMTDDDRRLLEFENTHPESGVRKATAVRVDLGLTPVRYEQRLHHMLEQREAIEAFPMAANRRQRLADARAGRRLARSF